MKRHCPLIHEGTIFMNEQETMHWLLRKTPTPWEQQRSSLCQPLGVGMDEQAQLPTAGLGAGHKGDFQLHMHFVIEIKLKINFSQ